MIPKFRAWLKSTGEMVEVLGIDFYEKEVAYVWTIQVSDYELEQTREVDKFDDVILMQSTGLKDKHGIEIFEGDIIQWTSEVTRQTDWVGLVKREKSSFVVWTSEKAYSTGSWLDVAHENVEIIGNQYEHHYLVPELLKENNKWK